MRVITPNNVIWPSGAIQNYGTFSCNASITINVEVYVVGVTDADPAAAGTDVHCVIHYGKVMSFGSAWSCIENESMIYAGADNGPNDVFTGTLSLQPGLYEFTCACSDQGFFY